MATPRFNRAAYEHPEDVQEILQSFQDMESANNAYSGDDNTSAGYMRNLSVAVSAAKIVSLMDGLDERFQQSFEPVSRAVEDTPEFVKDAVMDPAYESLSGKEPSQSNTVQALSTLHMAEIYDAWTEQSLALLPVETVEEMGVGSPQDLNAFRMLAFSMLGEAIDGLEVEGAEDEAEDLQILQMDVLEQIEENGGLPAGATHPVDKLNNYFSNTGQNPLGDDIRFIQILEQRTAIIFPPSSDEDLGMAAEL